MIHKAQRKAGEVPDLLDTEAVIRLALGDVPQAIRILERVAVTAPASSVYFHLARARYLAGNRVGAREALRQMEQPLIRHSRLSSLEQPLYARLVADLKSD